MVKHRNLPSEHSAFHSGQFLSGTHSVIFYLRGETETYVLCFEISDFHHICVLAVRLFSHVALFCQFFLKTFFSFLLMTEVDLVAAAALFAHITWNWNCNFCQNGTDTLLTGIQIILLLIWPIWKQMSSKVWSDHSLNEGWPPCMNWSTPITYIQHGQTSALHMEDVSNLRVSLSLSMKTPARVFNKWTSSLCTQPASMSCFLP